MNEPATRCCFVCHRYRAVEKMDGNRCIDRDACLKAQTENARLRAALATCRYHSLLAIRRAAFAPTIGVRYTEAIRADIASECARLEQYVDSVLYAPEEAHAKPVPPSV